MACEKSDSAVGAAPATPAARSSAPGRLHRLLANKAAKDLQRGLLSMARTVICPQDGGRAVLHACMHASGRSGGRAGWPCWCATETAVRSRSRGRTEAPSVVRMMSTPSPCLAAGRWRRGGYEWAAMLCDCPADSPITQSRSAQQDRHEHCAEFYLHCLQSGAGGVEAMDWAAMLERMYTRWAGARGFEVATTSRTPGVPSESYLPKECLDSGPAE